MFNVKTALILSPHPDDGELGCGGTIARMVAEGVEVFHAVFCMAEFYGNCELDPQVRLDEFQAAQKALGISDARVFAFHGPHRRLHETRQDILSKLMALNRISAPDIVFLPCLDDLHQDHDTVTREALRVFKKTSIFGYEMLWNNLSFKAQAFVSLDYDHLEAKVRALNEYKTQAERPYMDEAAIRAQCVSRGVQIGRDLAEAFEVIRWVQ